MEVQEIEILHQVEYDEEEGMYCCCDGCTEGCCFPDPTMSSNCTKACDAIITLCLDYDGITGSQCIRSNNNFRNKETISLFSSLSPEQIIYDRLSFVGDEYPSNVRTASESVHVHAQFFYHFVFYYNYFIYYA